MIAGNDRAVAASVICARAVTARAAVIWLAGPTAGPAAPCCIDSTVAARKNDHSSRPVDRLGYLHFVADLHQQGVDQKAEEDGRNRGHDRRPDHNPRIHAVPGCPPRRLPLKADLIAGSLHMG